MDQVPSWEAPVSSPATHPRERLDPVACQMYPRHTTLFECPAATSFFRRTSPTLGLGRDPFSPHLRDAPNPSFLSPLPTRPIFSPFSRGVGLAVAVELISERKPIPSFHRTVLVLSLAASAVFLETPPLPATDQNPSQPSRLVPLLRHLKVLPLAQSSTDRQPWSIAFHRRRLSRFALYEGVLTFAWSDRMCIRSAGGVIPAGRRAWSYRRLAPGKSKRLLDSSQQHRQEVDPSDFT